VLPYRLVPSATAHELKSLILSYHSIIAVETSEEERVGPMLEALARQLGLVMFEWSATRGLLRLPGTAAFFGTTDAAGALRHLEGLTVEVLVHLKDFTPHLTNPAVVRAVRDLAAKFHRTRSALVLSGDPVELPRELDRSAVFVEWRLPGEKELRGIVGSVARTLRARQNVRVSLESHHVDELARALRGLTSAQATQTIAWAGIDDGELGASDIQRVIRRKGEILRGGGGVVDFLPIPDEPMQLAGFGRLKRWLERARVGFTPDARALNLEPPRGLLLVGVQGCGKSLAAKFVASEWKLPLLKLDFAALYDKYIGESEKNLRRAFAIAESMAPSVLWIDEIEKGLAGDGSSESDGGVSRRILGSLLTWLQEKDESVFVVGVANDLFALPPELLRKGRFDEIFFVDLPGEEERIEIFRIHLALRKQDPASFDLPRLAEATAGFSGAEIEQAVIASLYRSLHEKRPLDEELICEEVRETVPLSVSRAEDVARLRATAAGRFTPVAG
jgi:hypothetical protein